MIKPGYCQKHTANKEQITAKPSQNEMAPTGIQHYECISQKTKEIVFLAPLSPMSIAHPSSFIPKAKA